MACGGDTEPLVAYLDRGVSRTISCAYRESCGAAPPPRALCFLGNALSESTRNQRRNGRSFSRTERCGSRDSRGVSRDRVGRFYMPKYLQCTVDCARIVSAANERAPSPARMARNCWCARRLDELPGSEKQKRLLRLNRV